MREPAYRPFTQFFGAKTLVFGTGILIAMLCLTVAITYYSLRRAEPTADNLLTHQNWQYFAGATMTAHGLLVQPLNRIITHQDGSLGQPNPPVNLAGPHLAVSGDFKVTARMERIGSSGSLRLYGRPPVVYDQWRYETGSIDIAVAPRTITVRIWDGSSSSPIDMRTYPFSLKSLVAITLEHRRDSLIISADNQVLGTIPDHHIFDGNEVWFGADAAIGDPWILSSLTAEPLENGRVEVVSPLSFDAKPADHGSLRNLASARPRKVNIGTAVAYDALVTHEQYKDIALGEFGMLTPENGMKPQFIHPQPDVYDFTEMDLLVAIALKNNMLVHGHTLVYAKSNPTWMSEAPTEDLPSILIDHVAMVADHFKGKIAEWDVVNEPLSDKKAPYHDERNGLEANIWYEVMGEQYIDLAFETAHQADPSAELYLNDYGLERDGERWDALLDLIARLKKRGVPIDGIGFESHIYGDSDYIDPAVLTAHMQKLATLGLKARISEIDVTGGDPEEQINQYVTALDTCLRMPNCTGYSTWGITDLFGSTTRSDRYPLVYGTSLLFDTDLQPKPVYSALKKRLRQAD